MSKNIVIIGAPVGKEIIEAINKLHEQGHHIFVTYDNTLIEIGAGGAQIEIEKGDLNIMNNVPKFSSMKKLIIVESERIQNELNKEKICIFENKINPCLIDNYLPEKKKTHLRMKSKFQPIPQPVNIGKHRNCKRKKRR